jgi:hypothetical protein
MGLVVNFLEPGRVKMRVYLGGGDIGMSQHELQSPEIGTLPEQVRGKGMAQGVRAEVRRQTDLAGIAFEDFPESLAA